MRVHYQDKDYWVGFKHEHFTKLMGGSYLDDPIFTSGVWAKGRTICTITAGDKENPIVVGYGEASCSEKDNFIKEIGRRMSLTRALEMSFGDNREARKTFWETYHARRTS